MTDSMQAEWESLGALWRSRTDSSCARAVDLAHVAVIHDREWRRAKWLIGLAWLLAFSIAIGLMVSSPFKGMAILLGILSSLTFAAAAPLVWTEDESGRQGLLSSLEKAIARQEKLVGMFWTGAAISMATFATVLFGVSRLLLVAKSQPHNASTWIALGAAALYGLAGLAFCGFRAWRARAELRRLADICRHLGKPTGE
jgi:hypothetical protein